MTRRGSFSSIYVAGAALATAGMVWAQAPAGSRPSAENWTVGRTADGQPDLQGIWDATSLTPLQRPVELGDKEFYTPEEAAEFEAKRLYDLDRDRRDGSAEADLARAYNLSWFDAGEHLAPNLRTSRVIDPPSGRFPAMLPAAAKKNQDAQAWVAEHQNDGPETRTLPDRCLVFSQSGPPFLPGNYNNNYQIVQAPGVVAILAEMGNITRLISLSDRPRLPENIRQWTGDSSGHWEGDTLVVETTNFRVSDQSRFGVQYYDGMTDENLRVVERFTRTGPESLVYQATVIDPTVFMQPWTVEIPMRKAAGPVFEYACHEGNYGMEGILSGARAEEKAGK